MLGFIKFLFFSSLIALAIGFYMGDDLPPPSALLPELEADPVQKPTDQKPFNTTVNGITYQIKPLFTYDLYGLVVSKHEADSFTDYVHKAWGDHLNTADICVIWGKNAFSGVYEKTAFSSGQWTCYFKISDLETWQAFSEEHYSNNHMLSDKPEISKRIKKTRIGDQIHFKGYLAEYSQGNFHRGTSIIRSDTGNGACETVYTESFEILKQGPRYWYFVRLIAAVVLLLSIVFWFRLSDSTHAKN